MNIIGIGTDIVSIPRIEKIWDKFGLQFARRILTKIEIEELQTVDNPIPFLSKRYAAKEAFAKAIGTGFRTGVRLTEIGVSHDSLGRPYLQFYGSTAEHMSSFPIMECHISLSDEKEFALAFVVLMGSQKNAPIEDTGAKH